MTTETIIAASSQGQPSTTTAGSDSIIQQAPTQVAPTAAPAAPTAQPAPSQAPAAATSVPDNAPNSVEGLFGSATDYQPTGNPNLDTALKWAGSLGLDIDNSPEMKAATQGNFGPLRALLASKEVPGSEAYIALAEAGYREAVAELQAKEQAVAQTVVQAAGGEEQWAEVFNWASENADQAEKDQINYAFEQGGFLAEAVANMLVQNYRAQAGVSVPIQATPVKATAGAQPATGSYGPLSPAEYAREVQNLRVSLKGASIEGSPEYAALQRRRMSYRGR